MNKNIYRQTDKRWKSLPYPTSKSLFGGNGCGACSVLHCIIERSKYANWTPADVQPYMKKHAVSGQGTTWAGIKAGLEYYGMENVKWFGQSATMASVFTELNKKNRIGVILFVKRSGKKVVPAKGPDGTYWTGAGHFIAFTDYKYENNQHWFYMKDSGDRHHDGWYSYEKSMKGCCDQVYTCTVPAEKEYEPTTPYSGTVPTKKVKKGDKNNYVKAVQEFLNWVINACLTVDGNFGPATLAAVLTFENKYGIPNPTGVFGPKCIAKANEIIDSFKPAQESYSGQLPSFPIKVDMPKSAYLAEIAKELAWAEGTKSSKYKYEGGSATAAFKTALDKVYPNRSSWSPAPRKGASCDVFAGTCVRYSGINTSFPRGFSEQFKVTKGFTVKSGKNVTPYSLRNENGCVMLYKKKADGSSVHALVYCNGKIYEAQMKNTYGHVNTSLSKIKKSYPAVRVLTPTGDISKTVNYIKKGDKSPAVGDWQDFLNWWSDGAFYKECGGRDNNFGANTEKWTIKFQEAKVGKGTGDGLVGNITIKAAKAVKK